MASTQRADTSAFTNAPSDGPLLSTRSGHPLPDKPNYPVSLSRCALAASFAARAPRRFVVPFA